jgi:hypothetical protein
MSKPSAWCAWRIVHWTSRPPQANCGTRRTGLARRCAALADHWLDIVSAPRVALIGITKPRSRGSCASIRRPPLGATRLLPKHVRAVAQVQVKGSTPILVCTALGHSILFPPTVCTFTDGLLQTRFGFAIPSEIVAVRRHLATPANMHSGGQCPEFRVGDRLAMSGSLQRLGFVRSFIRRFPESSSMMG